MTAPVIQVENVSRWFGNVVAVSEVYGQHVCPAAEFLRQIPQPIDPPRDEGQSVSATGEFARDLLADARRRTGHDDDAVVAARRKHGADNSLRR